MAEWTFNTKDMLKNIVRKIQKRLKYKENYKRLCRLCGSHDTFYPLHVNANFMSSRYVGFNWVFCSYCSVVVLNNINHWVYCADIIAEESLYSVYFRKYEKIRDDYKVSVFIGYFPNKFGVYIEKTREFFNNKIEI